MRVDVGIVGGGPAGLTAAIEISQKGGKVVVIDDHPKPGGKLLGQLHEEPGSNSWWKGYERAESLVNDAIKSGAAILSGKQVWSLEKGWKLFVSDTYDQGNDGGLTIAADAVLLATGAVEKPVYIEGWTLPGVITIGAAQVLTNVYGVKPGNRVVIAGIDVLSLSIARAMKLAGVDVVGIYMLPLNQFPQHSAVPYKLLESFESLVEHAPNPFMKLSRSLLKKEWGRKMAATFFPQSGIKVWGIPIHFRKSIVSIDGDREVKSVTISKIDGSGNLMSDSVEEKVDAVCLSGGLSPLYELASNLGCRFFRHEGLSGVVPLHNDRLETDVENLFIAGNITGIEGAKVAMSQGELAGKSICQCLGLGNVSDKEIQEAIKKVNEVRRSSFIKFHPKIDVAREELKKAFKG